MSYPELKRKLNEAFKDMRAAKLIARQNFSCCGSCAAYEITGAAAELVKKGRSVLGCCYYTRQDTTRLELGSSLFLKFGSMESSELGKIGEDTVEVGRRIIEILGRNGLKWVWSGKEDDCIEVIGWKAIKDELRAEEEKRLETERVDGLRKKYRRGSKAYAVRLAEMFAEASRAIPEDGEEVDGKVIGSIEQAIIDLKGEEWLDATLFKA